MQTSWSWWRLRLVRAGFAAALSTVVFATGCEFGIFDEAEESPTPTPAPEGSDDGQPGEAGGDPGALILVMDASGSMNETGPDGQTLLDDAKQALHDLVAELPDDQHVGLRVYGHRYPNTDRTNGCQDTELIHPVSPLDRPALTGAIDGFEAVGFTPIGLSLQEAANDLPPEGSRTIVLVSDGEDTCAPPEPCDVASELSADGIDLAINTVGFALGDNQQAREELQCIADAGGGEFRDTGNAAELADALQESSRDHREAELSGSELPGAPVPRDAATGQPDTRYTDTILVGEVNFYRFEFPPGTEVQGEVITSYRSEVDGCNQIGGRVALVDAGDSRYGGSEAHRTRAGEDATSRTNAREIEEGEVWIRIDIGRSRSSEACARASMELEVQLITL